MRKRFWGTCLRGLRATSQDLFVIKLGSLFAPPTMASAAAIPLLSLKPTLPSRSPPPPPPPEEAEWDTADEDEEPAIPPLLLPV